MTAAARKRADLVLSGGGIKGVALVGAVGALIDASVSPNDLRLETAGQAAIDWRRALTGTEACLTVAQELAPPRSAIRSLPQDEFQPAIRVFD